MLSCLYHRICTHLRVIVRGKSLIFQTYYQTQMRDEWTTPQRAPCICTEYIVYAFPIPLPFSLFYLHEAPIMGGHEGF